MEVKNLPITAVAADIAKFSPLFTYTRLQRSQLLFINQAEILASGEIRSRTVAATRCMMLSGIEARLFRVPLLYKSCVLFSEQFMVFNDINWGLEFSSHGKKNMPVFHPV